MKTEEISQLLIILGDKKASIQLASLVAEFQSTEHWNLLQAVIAHMVNQNLRSASGGVEGYGRAQGMSAVLDFFTWIKDYQQKVNSAHEEEPAVAPKQPTQGSYGLA